MKLLSWVMKVLNSCTRTEPTVIEMTMLRPSSPGFFMYCSRIDLCALSHDCLLYTQTPPAWTSPAASACQDKDTILEGVADQRISSIKLIRRGSRSVSDNQYPRCLVLVRR